MTWKDLQILTVQKSIATSYSENIVKLITFHISDMVIHMKTTLNISNVTMKQLKKEAARQGRTMSELVECALRMLLAKQESAQTLPPLPKFSSGGARVNVANREALYDVMERR